MAAKPSPKTVKTVCSVCDQPWESHGTKPTLETCVKLLKAELAKSRSEPRITQSSGTGLPWFQIPPTSYGGSA